MYVCAESIFVIMEPSQSKLEPWISKSSNLKNVTFLQNTIAEQKRDKIKEKKLIKGEKYKYYIESKNLLIMSLKMNGW